MRLNELAAAADVPVTSVKFFLREGLVPAGEKLNATTARYGERHRHRLELIRDLRRVVGLPLSAVREVVAAVEGLPRSEMMGAVQTVVLGGTRPPADDDATPGPADGPGPEPDGDAPLTAAEVGGALGWTTATPHAWAALDAHLADMRRWGLRPSLASVLPYARAVDGVAAAELGPLTRGDAGPAWADLGADASPDQVARYVALGVHAHARLLLRLLAVAQGHHAGASGESALLRPGPAPAAPGRRTFHRSSGRDHTGRMAEKKTEKNGAPMGPGTASIKDPEVYEALRREGASEEKAARIANASARDGRDEVAERGGEAGSYEDWTKDELEKRARELDIEGRSTMTKDELIQALRNH